MDEPRSPRPDEAAEPDEGAERAAPDERGDGPEPAEGGERDDAPRQAEAPIVVDVRRTGGFAGLTKVWTAEPREDEAPVWIDLISSCPWDDPHDGDARGADRFQWRIRATCGPEEDRSAELPDRALTGPWRDLVDAVRDWVDGKRDSEG